MHNFLNKIKLFLCINSDLFGYMHSAPRYSDTVSRSSTKVFNIPNVNQQSSSSRTAPYAGKTQVKANNNNPNSNKKQKIDDENKNEDLDKLSSIGLKIDDGMLNKIKIDLKNIQQPENKQQPTISNIINNNQQIHPTAADSTQSPIKKGKMFTLKFKLNKIDEKFKVFLYLYEYINKIRPENKIDYANFNDKNDLIVKTENEQEYESQSQSQSKH